MTKITSDEMKPVSSYIYQLSGIALDQKKAYLIESRLGPLLEPEGCNSFAELCQKARQEAGRSLELRIIDAITTGETLFFREMSVFELLKHKILPEIIDRHTGNVSSLLPPTLKIWSAACSTGQEVYSIAIVLKELLPDFNRFDIKLLGTDLSDAAIAQASYGNYNKFEIDRGLPKDKLTTYFHCNGNSWKINDELRALATFRRINLMGPLDELGRFDIVFCRNIAIYFGMEDRKKLFNKIADVLHPDGFLIIGATESLMGICPRFHPKRHLKSVFYQLGE